MKLRLPSFLFRAIIASAALSCACPTKAAVLYTGVSIATYTDFGQNMGRYRVNETNALMASLNASSSESGGVRISYLDGHKDYALLHGMVSFESQSDGGYSAAIGYNFTASVQHNASLNDTFSARWVGAENAIRYASIECVRPDSDLFSLIPNGTDHRISRQSKIITDITPAAVYRGTSWPATPKLMYRSGSGVMYLIDAKGNKSWFAEGYLFATGGIASVTGGEWLGNEKGFESYSSIDWSNAANESSPLPYAPGSGDSGSPVYIWNDDTGRYEYYASTQAGNEYTTSIVTGAFDWTSQMMDSFSTPVNISGSQTIYINAANEQGETLTDSNGVSTTLWHGTVTGDSMKTARYNGVQAGLNMWGNLAGVINNDNWYAYGTEFIAQPDADLFHTSNLVFTAHERDAVNIKLTGDIDLGAGYVEFRNGGSYVISSDGEFQLNSAGYIVGAGADVRLQLTGSFEHVAEWRKTGEGDLRIQGEGDNMALLNLGGSGKTYLERTGGYAAYNVLANNGTTVVLAASSENEPQGGVGQIKRDFTFGNGGGILDFNGNSMTWNNSVSSDAAFTIHALTEDAIIANSNGHSAITFAQSGSQEFLGSFQDSGSGSLQFIYNGGSGSVLTLRSIHTKLANEGSGITVQSGSVILTGKNTLHAIASSGNWTDRLFRADDWHYADVSAHVSIGYGAVFELGSHARLSGDVIINTGGTLIMREGTQQRYEYIEGWYAKEDVYAISDYYGLKGNVEINGGGAMKVEYSKGTTANTTYGGCLSGTGSLDIATGRGSLTLSGDNSGFSGAKRISRGTVIFTGNASLGDVSTGNKWIIGEKSILASHGFTNGTAGTILGYIDGSSSGILALASDIASGLDLSGHSGLKIGALEGHTVNYGEKGTTETLAAYNNRWKLGGGGGTLYVHFRLTGDNKLELGNGDATGTVILSNSGNDFTGPITLRRGMTLEYSEGALGGSSIILDYSARAALSETNRISEDSCGILLVTDTAGSEAVINMAGHASLSIGAEGSRMFLGSIVAEEGQAYRFSAANGVFTIKSALESGHSLIIDAQTYAGGTVLLNNARALTGDVVIMGRDNASTDSSGGDITLRFTENDVLGGIKSLMVRDGGTLDIGTSMQTIAAKNVTTEGSGRIISQKGGTLNLRVDEDSVLNMAADVDNLAISGSGAATLSRSLSYNSLTVDGGSLSFSSYAPDGTVHLANGGSASLSGKSVGNNFISTKGTGCIIGGASGGSGTDIWATSRINGLLDAAEGTELLLAGECLSLSNSCNNPSGGSIVINLTDRLDLALDKSGIEQRIGGVVAIRQDARILTNGRAEDLTRSFDHIDVKEGSTLTLDEFCCNTLWTIHHASGSGDIVWTPYLSDNASGTSVTDKKTSRLTLDGSGSLAGILKAAPRYDNALIPYASVLEIAHNEALTDAELCLEGRKNARAIAAVNTENAHVQGLSGNAYSHLYAGDAIALSGDRAPSSSRQATITIGGDGDYDYAGAIAGGGGRVSLAMEGTGVQKISGKDVTLGSVNVRQGSLELGADIKIEGSASVGSHALLALAEGSKLGLQSVTLRAGGRLAGAAGGSEVSADRGFIELGTGNTKSKASIVKSTALLTECGNAGKTLALKKGASLLVLNTDILSNITFTGGDITLDLTALGDLSAYKYISVSFGEAIPAAARRTNSGCNVSFRPDKTRVTAVTSTGRQACYTSMDAPSALFFEARSIPEPSSVILSLLGLTAISLRRRRR